jgi:hypothetical protein
VVTSHAFRRGIALGLLGGAAIVALRALQGRNPVPVAAPADWPAIPGTTPLAGTLPDEGGPEPEATPMAAWVEPVGGECPETHPVKAKLASGIFHVPGGFSYARTRPDRCYLDAAAAEADGLRPAKR